MKLNFGKKLVLFVHWLLSMAACALTVALLAWPECRTAAASALENLSVMVYAIAVLIVYLLFAVGAIAIIWDRSGSAGEHGFIVVDSNETGRTRIAVGAVEQMIRQAVRGVDGISQMKATINNAEDSISIDVDVTIVNGTHVPTVTMNIQRTIRSYIELNCGVAVRGVSVSVHSLTETEQSGWRSRRRNAERPAHGGMPSRPASDEAPRMRMPETEISVRREPEPEEVSLPEQPMPEPVEEAVVEQPAAKMKSFFKGFLGKRGASKAVEAEAEAEAAEPAQPASESADAEPEADVYAEEPIEADASEEIDGEE